MKTYTVYMHTNKINGKVYIGKTCQEPKKRYGSNGACYKQCPHFYKAIKKYGWDNFEHEIVMSGLSANEASSMEQILIVLFDSRNPEKGYNISAGGDGMQSEDSKRLWKNEEYRRHISDANKQLWADEEYHQARSNLYKEQWKDPAKRARRSEQAKKRWANEEFRQRASAAVLAVCASPVKCVETGEVFSSIVEACKKYNIKHHANINKSIRTGVRCNGYHWKRP